jgi:lysophospholipase L1-like esterase
VLGLARKPLARGAGVILAVASIAGVSTVLVAHAGGPASSLRIVALGDSDTAGNGDPIGIGWVGRYARLLRQRVGLTVSARNLALDGTISSSLLTAVRSDSMTRSAIAGADVVPIGIGGADLNAGDDRWQSRACHGKACYARDLKAFARNFDKSVATIAKLRRGKKTVLRAITLPNALTGAEDVIPSLP